jgi:O-antigen/teichoic acid export membrane protein
MNPFRNILRLSLSDFVAKTLNFVAFVYLARVLGVSSYGALEFSLSILAYFLLFADGGLELWATREAAHGTNVRELVGRIVPLRVILAFVSYGALFGVLLFLPNYPNLRTLMILFGLTLFSQAVNLKWVFMGQEKMTRVGIGLIVAQFLFIAPLFLIVRRPEAIIWVPLVRLAGDLAMAIYFAWQFNAACGGLRLPFTFRGASEVLRQALTLGASYALGLISFNLDSVLLGFLLGATAVGFYGAAYKPVTVVLAMPMTYFIGLFPALSRAYSESHETFREIFVRSLRLTWIFALPIGIGGIFLAGPIINLLFGPAYANSVPALRILSWSAVFVVLRGTYRQGLNAAHRSRLDLWCGGTSVAINLILNLLLIPRFGIIGAAFAIVASDALWFVMVAYQSNRYVIRVNLLPLLLPSAAAAAVMGACFLVSQSLFWIAQAFIGLVAYFVVLLLLGQTEARSWIRARKAQLVVS